MIRQLPPASEGGDRVMVGISKIVAESVNGCANTLPVYVPGAGGASGKCGTKKYKILPFTANRAQQHL